MKNFKPTLLLTLFFTTSLVITSCVENPGNPIEARVTYEIIVYDNPTDMNPMMDLEVLIGSQKEIPTGGLEGTVQVTTSTNSLGRAKITSTYELFENEQIEFVALLDGCTQSHCQSSEIVSYEEVDMVANGSEFVALSIPDLVNPDVIYLNP